MLANFHTFRDIDLTADPDRDGFSHWMEWIHGLHPLQYDRSASSSATPLPFRPPIRMGRSL
jgi:hypothetical protein